MRLSITRTARDELEHIGDEIARTSPMAARRMVRMIRERTREIADFPYAFQRLETEADPPLRRRVVGSYLIVYRIEDDRILILHILHAARDVAAFLDLPD